MRERAKRVLAISAVVLLSGCAYLFLYTTTGLGVPCIFHLITGLNCPGCGITRMILSLLKLDWKSAFHFNAVLFCMMPFFMFLFVFWICRYIRLGTQKLPKPMEIICFVAVGVLLVWGILRNMIGM